MKPCAGWNSLPAELQLEVLSYMSWSTLSILRLVAVGWRDLANDPLLRAKFHLFVDRRIPPEEIEKLVVSKPSLMTVTMRDHQLSQSLLEVMLRHSNLTTVHLRAVNMAFEPSSASLHPISDLLLKPIFERRLAASWLGAWGVSRRAWPTLYINSRKGSDVFKSIELIYNFLYDSQSGLYGTDLGPNPAWDL